MANLPLYSWIMRNKPSMRVRRVIMRADGDEGSREMEARVKTWKGLDIEEWKEVHLR